MWSTGSLNADAVPVEAREYVGKRSSLMCTQDDVHLIDDRKARGEERDRPTGVHEHVFDVGRSGERVAVVKLRDRGRRVDRVVEQRVREPEGVRDGIGGRDRMDEHDRRAPLQRGDGGRR
jgi:hypothetical protein